MNVLVTGATGFVGSHLVSALIQKDYKVKCLIRKHGREIKNNEANVQYLYGDITNKKSIMGISEDVDYVIHLAAIGHVSAVTEESYRRFVDVNERGTKNLIDVFRKSSRLKKFIHYSSTAAMGRVGVPIIDEKSTLNPITPYQKSKRRSEIIVEEAFLKHGFPAVILRPCMIYGPGGYGEFYKFCRLMKKGIFPKVGFGKNLTPLVYIDDVIAATCMALEKGILGETYIIASQTSIPMDEMHKLILKALGVKRPYIYIPRWMAMGLIDILEKYMIRTGKEPIASKKNIVSITTNRTFDISKAKNDIGYEPRYSFEEGIVRTVNWYKKEGVI